MALDTSVYVHFPWCAKRCPYCDFATSKIDPVAIPHDAYADAVIAELRARSETLRERRLFSVFFGGGTPSLWRPASLGRVLAAIRDAFSEHVGDVEVTAECNPASLDRAHARALVEAGVGRLSVGVQSLRNDQLQYLGRLHDRAGALAALDAAREAPRRSADLMFGMPGQRELVAEIEGVVTTGVGHVSAYALTIEPGTQFGERQRLGKLQVSSDETYATLFEEAETRFAAAGFAHYEVSNYARPGDEARHNLHYWRGGDYVGLGAAAVGCLSAPGSARRWRNMPSATEYMRAPITEESEEHLTAQDRIREALMLGLRTSEGVDLETLEARMGTPPLEGRERDVQRRVDRGDLELDGRRLVVPRERWLHLDGIVSDLF